MIKNLINKIIGKVPEEELSVKLPEVGEVWALHNDFDSNDPFPKSSSSIVPIAILDIKDNWVRYKIGRGILWGDERKPIVDFMRIYKFYKAKDENK